MFGILKLNNKTMKKIFILIPLLLLISCGMTQEEMLNKKQECTDLGFTSYYNSAFWERIVCSYKIQDPVMKCIEEYTNWLDEKYNNPDIVTNLREDEYSNVVRTCNEIFLKLNK